VSKLRRNQKNFVGIFFLPIDVYERLEEFGSFAITIIWSFFLSVIIIACAFVEDYGLPEYKNYLPISLYLIHIILTIVFLVVGLGSLLFSFKTIKNTRFLLRQAKSVVMTAV
jgi:hypothetical protein